MPACITLHTSVIVHQMHCISSLACRHAKSSCQRPMHIGTQALCCYTSSIHGQALASHISLWFRACGKRYILSFCAPSADLRMALRQMQTAWLKCASL